MMTTPSNCTCLLVTLLTVSITGISCVSVPKTDANLERSKATEILRLCAEAHGAVNLCKLQDVSVRFEGEWAPFIASVQPVLVNKEFRGVSEERYLIEPHLTAQIHVGSGGRKSVFRDPDSIAVSFNGVASEDPAVRAAAALVADAYRMFLFGPYFFIERNASLGYLGTGKVDGMACDELLATLKPGIGNSPEDRIILSIDHDHHLLRRVRMTLEGLETTRGAIVDVYLRDPVRVAGVVWPTRFYEELERPFKLSVHRWRLTGIDVNRGITPGELKTNPFSGAADRPAGTDR